MARLTRPCTPGSIIHLPGVAGGPRESRGAPPETCARHRNRRHVIHKAAGRRDTSLARCPVRGTQADDPRPAAARQPRSSAGTLRRQGEQPPFPEPGTSTSATCTRGGRANSSRPTWSRDTVLHPGSSCRRRFRSRHGRFATDAAGGPRAQVPRATGEPALSAGLPRPPSRPPRNGASRLEPAQAATSSRASCVGSSATSCSSSMRSAISRSNARPPTSSSLPPRSKRGSIIITSNRSLEQWSEILGDAMVAAAVTAVGVGPTLAPCFEQRRRSAGDVPASLNVVTGYEETASATTTPGDDARGTTLPNR